MSEKIDALRDQIARRIQLAEAAVKDRDEQIEALQAERNAMVEQIAEAREALAKLDDALAAVSRLSLDQGDETEGEKERRVQQKRVVEPIVKGAETEGILFEDIVAHARRSSGVDLKPASLKAFLSKMKADGVYEQVEGRWRVRAVVPAAQAAAE